MIGIYAILWDFALLAPGLFILVAACWDLISSLRRKSSNVLSKNDRSREPWELLAIVALVVIWLAGLSYRFLAEVGFHSELSHLRPEIVDRIQIGNQAVSDRRQIAEIIVAIRQPEWYSMLRRDSADKVSFVVILASGKQYRYEATRYLRGEAAALVGQSPSGWDRGEVLCPRLPAALRRAGVSLPDCFTYFGKPVQCAQP